MSDVNIAELEAATAAAKQLADENPDDDSLQQAYREAEDNLTKAKTPPADPIKSELDKVRGSKKSEAEKLTHSLKGIAKRAKEIGIDPMSILGDGIDPNDGDDEDNKPVTLGMMKKMEQERAQQTALSMAQNIEDESERELAIHHLQNTIKPSGSAEADFATALTLVNALKNSQILEEVARKSKPKAYSSAAGAPANREERFEPTPEEAAMMASFNLTKEDILKARATK